MVNGIGSYAAERERRRPSITSPIPPAAAPTPSTVSNATSPPVKGRLPGSVVALEVPCTEVPQLVHLVVTVVDGG